ncbi:hypothetical protein [Nitriliruptor alkaliphilus]|uniref:hypothetical protein n=1 Tax=Nitriliruptor alkaliphilus TaxID=427918 RepID=UPI00069821F3|nr:hypothetical protein [Nitriliruptor alkaliphilus]
MADASWFEDELEVAPRPRRRLVLVLALVATSWIVLALVLVRGDGRSAGMAPATHDHAAAPEEQTDAEPLPEAVDPADDEVPSGAIDPPPSTAPSGVTVSREEAEALTLAVVRGWLSDGGPDLGLPGIEVDRRAYLEHAAIEGMDLPSDDLAVARVLLVLLVREDDRYVEATVRRAAVPLTVTPTSVHPGGTPWWLPDAPDLTPVPPATQAVHDPDLADAVLAALTEAGYRAPGVSELAVTGAGTIVAEVTATTPSGDEVAGPIWLAATGDGPVVLGRAREAPMPPGPPTPGSDAPTDPAG